MRKENSNILLVDDDKGVRSSIRLMLLEMGINQVTECKDGQEALAYFDLHPEANISLVICDWNMPQKTGMEVLREIKQVYPDLPFLMVTARGDEGSVLAAKSSQVDGYILKPFSFNDLKTKVFKLLGVK